MADEANLSKSTTTVLPMQSSAEPLPERGPRPATHLLAPPWRVLLQVGSENKTTVGIQVREYTVLGRADGKENDADVDLNPYGALQNGVSRRHAAIAHDKGALYIEDLESTNGTRINGFQLTPNQKYRLRDGDELELGRIRIVVRFVRPSA
ncbi:MAG: FHA domain-containing protein [Chloroflexi bacterium]|nr:FHA domain-containing protein [Chloroflexota bacterium]